MTSLVLSHGLQVSGLMQISTFLLFEVNSKQLAFLNNLWGTWNSTHIRMKP